MGGGAVSRRINSTYFLSHLLPAFQNPCIFSFITTVESSPKLSEVIVYLILQIIHLRSTRSTIKYSNLDLLNHLRLMIPLFSNWALWHKRWGSFARNYFHILKVIHIKKKLGHYKNQTKPKQNTHTSLKTKSQCG